MKIMDYEFIILRNVSVRWRIKKGEFTVRHSRMSFIAKEIT